jgi:hypothetical protein
MQTESLDKSVGKMPDRVQPEPTKNDYQMYNNPDKEASVDDKLIFNAPFSSQSDANAMVQITQRRMKQLVDMERKAALRARDKRPKVKNLEMEEAYNRVI